MSMTVAIPRRFRGPQNSANGGYACGLIAAFVPGAVQVTLRQPPPLEHRIRIVEGPPVQGFHKELLVLEAAATTVELEVPEAPSYREAKEWSTHYIGLAQHRFPECFVCGPTREAGDGLRIFPGRLPGTEGLVAAPWKPHASLTGGQMGVSGPVLWAALDCAGYYAVAAGHELAVLGRMAARIEGSVAVGERCRVIGWPLGREGRKLHAATALIGEDGRVVGRSRQTWITLKDPDPT